PSGFSMKSIFNTGSGGTNLAQLPAISLANGTAYGGGFTINPGFMPWINSNPVYDYRDTVTKIIRSHNLTFGGEFVVAQRTSRALRHQSVLAASSLLTKRLPSLRGTHLPISS